MNSVNYDVISGGKIMNRWEDTVLTDKGAAFHSKLANGQTLKITRVMTGAAKVPVVNLRQQTGVTDEGKQRFEESYEFFSIISSRLLTGRLPIIKKNYRRWHLLSRCSLLQQTLHPFST